MKEAFAGLEFGLTEMCFPLIIIPWAWDIRINCKWFWGSIIYCIILAASLLFPYPREVGGGQAPNFQEQWIIAGNCVANYHAKVVVNYHWKICADWNNRHQEKCRELSWNIVSSKISLESQEKPGVSLKFTCITFACSIVQYRSKVSYHRLARRVSFLSRFVSRETRRVSRETRRDSFLASALEVPILHIRRYSKPVLCIKMRVSYHID